MQDTLLGVIAGVLIGAVIGYGTNYIAVKMLFRPHKKIMIGSFSLPLTPGIIPRRQPQLAKALGDTVATQLFTKEDLKDSLLSEEMKNGILKAILQKVKSIGVDEEEIGTIVKDFISEGYYDRAKNRIEDLLCRVIQEGMEHAGLGNIIVDVGVTAVREKMSGTMMGMFLNESMIQSLAEPIGGYVEQYIADHGQEVIRPIVEECVIKVEDTSVSGAFDALGVSDEMMELILGKLCDSVLGSSIDQVLEHLEISKIVEEKVNAMDPAAIEELVLSVMKKELNMVVRLGALIGAVLGLLNGLF